MALLGAHCILHVSRIRVKASATVLTIDNSCLMAGGFKKRAHNFSLMMANVTSKHLGDTLEMYVIYEYCAFGWRN
jgi:hypothetical protein